MPSEGTGRRFDPCPAHQNSGALRTLARGAFFFRGQFVETIALAVYFQDMDKVGETVQQRPGQAFGAEHLGLLVEGQIAGHQGGTALVALAEHLEQQFGSRLRERHEAEFVDDQQAEFRQLPLETQQALLIAT